MGWHCGCAARARPLKRAARSSPSVGSCLAGVAVATAAPCRRGTHSQGASGSRAGRPLFVFGVGRRGAAPEPNEGGTRVARRPGPRWYTRRRARWEGTPQPTPGGWRTRNAHAARRRGCLSVDRAADLALPPLHRAGVSVLKRRAPALYVPGEIRPSRRY